MSSVCLQKPARRSITPIYLDGRADRLQAVEDPRSRQILRDLARAKGCNMSQLIRTLLLEEYLRVFRRAPEGEAFAPRPVKSAERRAYQNAYSRVHRQVRGEGGTLAKARRLARQAGAKAAAETARGST